jgi:hypothetical protein
LVARVGSAPERSSAAQPLSVARTQRWEARSLGGALAVELAGEQPATAAMASDVIKNRPPVVMICTDFVN